jgi:hypothetical protein
MYSMNNAAVQKIFNNLGQSQPTEPFSLQHLAMNKVLETVHTPIPIRSDIGMQLVGGMWIELECKFFSDYLDHPPKHIKVDMESIDRLPLPPSMINKLKAQRAFHRKFFERSDLYDYLKDRLTENFPKIDLYKRCMFFDCHRGHVFRGLYAFGAARSRIHMLPDGEIGFVRENAPHNGGNIVNELYENDGQIVLDPVPGLKPIINGQFEEYYSDFYFLLKNVPFESFWRLALIPQRENIRKFMDEIYAKIAGREQREKDKMMEMIDHLFYGIPQVGWNMPPPLF